MESIKSALQFNREFNTVRALTESIADTTDASFGRKPAFSEDDIRTPTGDANWNKLMSVESHISSEQPSFGTFSREISDEDKIDILSKTADVLRSSGKETFNITHLDAFSTLVATSTGHNIDDVASVLREFIDKSQGKENLQEFDMEEEFPTPFEGEDDVSTGESVESLEIDSNVPEIAPESDLDVVDVEPTSEDLGAEPELEEIPDLEDMNNEEVGLDSDLDNLEADLSGIDSDTNLDELDSEIGGEEVVTEEPVETEGDIELPESSEEPIDTNSKELPDSEEEPVDSSEDEEDNEDEFDFDSAKSKLEAIQAKFESEMEKTARKAMFESALGELETEYKKAKKATANFDSKAQEALDKAVAEVKKNRVKLDKKRDLEKDLTSKKIEAKLEAIIEARKEKQLKAKLEAIAAKAKEAKAVCENEECDDESHEHAKPMLESRQDKIEALRKILRG